MPHTYTFKFNADGSHECAVIDCNTFVEFDDEPYCYTHSPSSGSNVAGYSYAVTAYNAVFAL
jgi:hypothetical protein